MKGGGRRGYPAGWYDENMTNDMYISLSTQWRSHEFLYLNVTPTLICDRSVLQLRPRSIAFHALIGFQNCIARRSPHGIEEQI